jgi:hypothetical protein
LAVRIHPLIRNNFGPAVAGVVGTNNVLSIYSGTRPAAGGAIGASVLLVQLVAASAGGAHPFMTGGYSSGGRAPGTVVALGSATWFRLTTSGGAWLMDGNVGTSGSDLNITPTTTGWTVGSSVNIPNFSMAIGNAA